MAEYLKRTDSLRSTSHLWISFKKPFKAVGRQTISRWLKTLLHMAGLDISIFTGHSTRMAATSKVNNMGVGLHTILATAGWNSESNLKKNIFETNWVNRTTLRKRLRKQCLQYSGLTLRLVMLNLLLLIAKFMI